MRVLLVLLLTCLAAPVGATPPWHNRVESVATRPLGEVFQPPPGMSRTPVAPSEFGEWLLDLPVRQDRKDVRSFDGRRLSSPSAGVVLMDVGTRDLQQCADTAIRLFAEWKWSRGEADDLRFHFTSGDVADWKSWREGTRWWLRSERVQKGKTASSNASYASFRTYLDLVFLYAGTRSLASDSRAVETPERGDFFVQPGSPGHVVIVLDVVTDSTGKRFLLLGQGFMPAQELHVLRSSDAVNGVWFAMPDANGSLKTPSWKPFLATELRRFTN